jgi:hypothetical protein
MLAALATLTLVLGGRGGMRPTQKQRSAASKRASRGVGGWGMPGLKVLRDIGFKHSSSMFTCNSRTLDKLSSTRSKRSVPEIFCNTGEHSIRTVG